MSVDVARRANLLGVPEHRAITRKFEFRTDPGTGLLVFEGYASTFDPYDCYGGPDRGGWIEQIDVRAFDETLAANPDVMLLIEHEGLPLARTKSGTMALRADSHGLFTRAMLDPSDPDVQRIAPKMARKDLDEMSFGFRVTKQDWSDDYTVRTIRNLNLDMGDVSIVPHGMNSNTAAILSAGVEALASLSHKQLVELRGMDRQKIQRAAAVLSRAAGGPVKARYADPGYRADGKPRYRLDCEERIRNAWLYIHMDRNARNYSPDQLVRVKAEIRAAAEELGVDVDEGKRSTPPSPIKKPSWPTDAPQDPHDCSYDKEDLGEMDHEELHGDPAPQPAADAGQAFRGNGENLADGHQCEDDGCERGEDGEDCEDDEGDEDCERIVDLGLAAALDSTIVSCLNLVGENPQLRNLLDRARRQLAELRGEQAPPEPKSSVDERLSELRSLMGVPVVGNVEDCLAHLRREGIDTPTLV